MARRLSYRSKLLFLVVGLFSAVIFLGYVQKAPAPGTGLFKGKITGREDLDSLPADQGQRSNTGLEKDTLQQLQPKDNDEKGISATSDKQRFKDRLDLVHEVCRRYSEQWDNLTLDGYVYTYMPKNLVYCVTPKVGCTFWKRVIRFLNDDYIGQVSNPAEIDRMYVHFGKMENTLMLHLNTTRMRRLLGSLNTFMFTRDPYSRLWSAYVDKIFLPDFWTRQYKEIISMVRNDTKAHFNTCASELTFQEFLTYVVMKAHSGKTMNEHIAPVYTLCNPCLMKFDYIGKQETFASDSEFILRQHDLDYLTNNYNPTNRVVDELNTLIEYNFQLERKVTKGCFDKMLVSERLWQAFQFNGYLPKNVSFPSDSMQLPSNQGIKERLTKQVIDTFEQYKHGSSLWKKQRRESMIENYRKVSPSTLFQLQSIYKPDFELFGYESQPGDIFDRVMTQRVTYF